MAPVGATSKTVSKAFRVLGLFRSHRVVTSTLCERELGIPRATAHRMLVSLTECGAVEQTRDGHFKLGLALFELGSCAPQRRELSDICGNDLELLADRTGFRVHVAVRHDLKILYLDAAHGPDAQAQGIRTRAGYCGPLHATAGGQLLMAYAPESVVEGVIAGGLKTYTPWTITEPGKLRDALVPIRKDGVSFAVEQYVSGIAALALPLRAHDGEVRAVLSVVGSKVALIRQRAQVQEQARQTALRIEGGQAAIFRERRGDKDPLVVAR